MKECANCNLNSNGYCYLIKEPWWPEEINNCPCKDCLVKTTCWERCHNREKTWTDRLLEVDQQRRSS
jgi:hypothetical protein